MNKLYLIEGPDKYFEGFIIENKNEYHNSKDIYFRDIIRLIDNVSLDSVIQEIKETLEEFELLLIVKTEDFFLLMTIM